MHTWRVTRPRSRWGVLANTSTALTTQWRTPQSALKSWRRCMPSLSLMVCGTPTWQAPPAKGTVSPLSIAYRSHGHSAAEPTCLRSLQPTWKDLMQLLVAAPCFEENKDHSSSQALGCGSVARDAELTVLRRDSPVRRVWLALYHPLFDAAGLEAPSPLTSKAVPRGRSGDPSSGHDGCAESVPHDRVRVPPLSAQSVGDGGDGFCPLEATELPLFVQALGTLATTLGNHIRGQGRCSRDCDGDDHGVCVSTATTATSSLLSSAEAAAWLSELQAVLLYVGHRQLRHLIPHSLWQAVSPVASATPLAPNTRDAPTDSMPARHHRTAQDDASSPLSVSSSSPTSSSLVSTRKEDSLSPSGSASPSLRPLSRPEEERLRFKAPPLPQEDLLRVVVLVEAARTVLDVAVPPAAASSVRAELYMVLLSVVGASEQLSSPTLASLTTCLARCVDSYTMRQLLPPLETAMDDASLPGAEGGPGEAGRRGNLRLYYRSMRQETCDSEEGAAFFEPSALEQAEAKQLAAHRGGLGSLLRPVGVLQQLAVVANVAHHRLARVLRALEKERAATDSLESRSAGFSEEPSRERFALASTRRLAREESIEDGLLGLLSLEERKSREAKGAAADAASATALHDQGSSEGGRVCARAGPPKRTRRTIAMIQAEAAGNAASSEVTKDDSNACAAAVPPTDNAAAPFFDTSLSALADTASMSLTDAAEICTALAAMGYRGGDGSADATREPWWTLVVDLARTEIDTVAAEAGQATARGAGKEVGESEAVRTQLLTDCRDVVFALDTVGHTTGYDAIMASLVSNGFLSAPIPAPSVTARAMRDVK